MPFRSPFRSPFSFRAALSFTLLLSSLLAGALLPAASSARPLPLPASSLEPLLVVVHEGRIDPELLLAAPGQTVRFVNATADHVEIDEVRAPKPDRGPLIRTIGTVVALLVLPLLLAMLEMASGLFSGVTEPFVDALCGTSQRNRGMLFGCIALLYFLCVGLLGLVQIRTAWAEQADAQEKYDDQQQFRGDLIDRLDHMNEGIDDLRQGADLGSSGNPREVDLPNQHGDPDSPATPGGDTGTTGGQRGPGQPGKGSTNDDSQSPGTEGSTGTGSDGDPDDDTGGGSDDGSGKPRLPGPDDFKNQPPVPPILLPPGGEEDWPPEACGVYEIVCDCGRGQLCRIWVVVECPEPPSRPPAGASASHTSRPEEPDPPTPPPPPGWPTNTPEPLPNETPAPAETPTPAPSNTPVPLDTATPADTNTPEPLPTSTHTPPPVLVCGTLAEPAPPGTATYPAPGEPVPPSQAPPTACHTSTPAPTQPPPTTNTPVPLPTDPRPTNSPVPVPTASQAPPASPAPSNTPVFILGQCRAMPEPAGCRGGNIDRGMLQMRVVEICHQPGIGADGRASGTELVYKVRLDNASGQAIQGQAHPVVVDRAYANSTLGRISCFTGWSLAPGASMTIAGIISLERNPSAPGGARLEFRTQAWLCGSRFKQSFSATADAPVCAPVR